MTRLNRKQIVKSLLAAALSIAMLVTGSGLMPGATAQAATLSHVKASASDYVQGNLTNMKGVQGTEVTDKNGISMLNEMNIHQAMLNVNLTDIIDTTHTGTPYTYKGKTYYFNEAQGSMLKVLEARVKEYREQDVSWTFCLVMSDNGTDEIHKLMYNYQPGKIYYALNVLDADAADQIEATLRFMANRFGYSDTFVQNWRVGNEVNVSHDYNFTGAGKNGIALESTLVDLAVKSYELLDEALKAENPYAKAFVSVTHDWNNDNEGTGVPTKKFLDQFAAKVSDSNWNLDFHAYPPQMKEQVWTKASAAYLTHDVGTQFICAPNFEVLTNYIKNNFGSNHRIILSEQSYDSTYGEEEQAAMIAYTYYAAVNSGMVDAVTFTTWQDTNSVYHDYYNMGMLDINGNKKASYDVFKYMNTNDKTTYVDPYLAKFSNWTGRSITSWSDDILYQPEKTTATVNSASLYYPEDQQDGKSVFIGLTTSPTKDELDLEYKWTGYNYTTRQSFDIKDWALNSEWLRWFPTENATYKITCTVRVAGNPSSTLNDSKDIVVNIAGNPNSVAPPAPVNPSTGMQGTAFTTTAEGYTFTRDDQGKTRCYDSQGKIVINDFKCDGEYTYYFQADGTAMTNRLTYHPDGVHVIYFDENGYEVFSDFANVKQAISGEAVDDLCFFNVYGYMYVDTLTYDKTGTKLYYINPYGRLECNKWFQFSGKEFDAGLGFSGRAGGYGYANADCSLMTNTYTYDWQGNYVYVQGDGHVFYN